MQISTNAYAKIFIRALLMLAVRTPLVPTSAVVFLDTKKMDDPARTLMNATWVFTIAVFMHTAITPLAPMAVDVWKDSKEMVYHVKM